MKPIVPSTDRVTREVRLIDAPRTYAALFVTTDDGGEAIDVVPAEVAAQLERELAAQKRDPYPDNEADGVVFCGKCGCRR
jgi:hypothetical protein